LLILGGSHLSQAPDAFGTSTSVAIGGMGLQPGRYTVKVKCEVDEDAFTIDVPDSSVILPEIKKKQDITIIIKKIINTKNKQLNNVKDIHLQKVGELMLFTVRRYDDTEYSVIMNDRSMSQVEISDMTIDKIRTFMDKSRNHILRIADEYVTKDRKESSFFNDVVTLANCLSGLSAETDYLLKLRETTELLHNRIVAQLLNYYTQIGCQVNPKPIVHNKNSRRHDFNVQGLKCEVKTIQTIGEIEINHTAGVRFTHEYAEMLIKTMRRDLEDAMDQLQAKGMIFIAPWSYKLSGVLRQAFHKEAVMFPPPPQRDLTVLVLESKKAFEDFYVPLPTAQALQLLTMAIHRIQMYGVKGSIFPMIREGMPMRITTSANPGSRAGYSFKV
jgi:hypothetical protein